MNPFALSGFLTGIASLTMGGFVLFKAPEKPLNRIWAVFTIAVAVWGFGGGWIGLNRDPTSSFLVWRLIYAFGVSWIPVLFYHLVLHLCQLQNDAAHKKRLLAQYLIVAALVPIFLFSQSALAGVRLLPETTIDYVTAGPLLWPYLLWWVGLTGYVHWLVFQIYRRAGGVQRNQLRYFFIAFLLSYSTGSLCYLPAFGVDVYPYGNFGIMFYPVIVTYAIGTYRLMDIQTVIHKTIAWAAMSSLLVVPTCVILVMSQGLLGDVPPVLQALFIGVVLLLILPYSRWLQPNIDHLFQRRRKDLGLALQTIAHEMSNLGLDVLVDHIVAMFRETLYVSDIGIFIWDGKNHRFQKVNGAPVAGDELRLNQMMAADPTALDWMREVNSVLIRDEFLPQLSSDAMRDVAAGYFHRFGAQIILPFIHETTVIGLIHLGAKHNLQPFSGVETEFLSTFRDQIAPVLRNSILYEDIQVLTHELRQWTTELEARVDTRTADLVHTNLALEGAFQQLKEYDEMKDAFFANINHEMRIPLTMILPPMDALLNQRLGALTAEQTQSLQGIHNQTRRLLHLVNKILYLAKLDAGAMSLSPQKADLTEFVQKMTDSFAPYAAEKSLTLRFERRGDLPEFYFDMEKIERALSSLIFNALKHTHQGSVVVSCGPDAQGALIVVTDTGIGIPTATLPKLFRRHFGGGSRAGSDLAIVKSIIDLHHGQVGVASTEGQGTTFSMTLPVMLDLK